MILRHIQSMGVELEGGWERGQVTCEIRGDGSVRGMSAYYVGEIPSPVFPTWQQAKEWITRHIPAESNNSCGMHVHIRLSDEARYSALMALEFQNAFQEDMEKLCEHLAGSDREFTRLLRHRMSGENRYCMIGGDPDLQVRIVDKGAQRYFRWNFCYARHKTAECRLLPGTANPNTACFAIRSVLASVAKFLTASAKTPELLNETEIVSEMGHQIICV